MKNLPKILFTICFLLFAFGLRGQIITTVAGNGSGGYSGEGGQANLASIGYCVDPHFDKQGNYYFTNRLEHRVLKVDITTGIIHTVAGNGIDGFGGDNGPATAANLDNPLGIAFDDSDNLYIAEINNNRVRKVNALTGIITTFVGNGAAIDSGDNGPALNAGIFGPLFLCFDPAHNLYISDIANKIRKVDAGTHIIHTYVGKGATAGFSGDNGPADSAQLFGPQGICTDSLGNLFIADLYNYRIRKVNATTGIITTIAGDSSGFYNGEGLLATLARLVPFALNFNKHGELYIADWNNRIRKIDVTNHIYTVAGNGNPGFAGDNGPADSAEMYKPEGIGFDSCNNLYFADELNRRIRKVTFDTSCGHTTAVNNIIAHLAIEIYPNPSTNQFTISYLSTLSQNTRADLYNITGQLVFSTSLKEQNTIVSTASLVPGIYVCKIINEGRRMLVRKVLVVK